MLSTIGFSEEVKIGVSDSVFLTEPEEEDVRTRINELKAQMEGASEFDADKLRYRIGRLTGGVATVFAGGATALEAKERRDRVVDAVSAVRTALDSGVVPGGGSTLLHISRKLTQVKPNQIFAQALARPYIQILMNAGVAANPEEALYIGNNVGSKPEGFIVYDALKRAPVEFWSSGIFDPTKVTINALQNALSVAQLLMTCGGAIAKQMSDGEDQVKAMQKMVQSIQNGDIA
jgi:chaperonin GroEL